MDVQLLVGVCFFSLFSAVVFISLFFVVCFSVGVPSSSVSMILTTIGSTRYRSILLNLDNLA